MKIAEIEYTPNPNAVKFVLKDALTAMGYPRFFEDAEAAREHPLADELFAIEGVASVFFADRWLTVTQDGRRDWPEMLRELAGPIRAMDPEIARAQVAPANDEPGLGAPSEGMGEGLDDARIPMIREVLDEHITPFLASDGGGLELLGLADERLLVRFQGACGTCPASMTGTLMAIENLIQMEVDPDLEVVAV